MKKILFIVLDGLGDEPIPEFENKTPLEAANTPNIDLLVKKGSSGLLEPNFSGIMPTSEEGHYSLFGYDPERYKIKRGVLTALSAGIKLERGDIAFRGNFASVDENFMVIDRRAGRIKETEGLISSLRGIKIGNIEILVEKEAGHRLALILRGKGLSAEISDGDPHYKGLGDRISDIVPLDGSPEALLTAETINTYLKKSHQILKEHPDNKKREMAGLLPANYILLRGAGSFIRIPSFWEKYGLRAACVAEKSIYQSIAQTIGMDIIKTDEASLDLEKKIQIALSLFKDYDFVFVHEKKTDTFAEDGDYLGKKNFIEKIDKSFASLSEKGIMIVITSDHSTCSLAKSHCSLPIPLLIFDSDMAPDKIETFSEKECFNGSLGKIPQLNLMDLILKQAKNLK